MRKLLRRILGIDDDLKVIKDLCNSNFITINEWVKNFRREIQEIENMSCKQDDRFDGLSDQVKTLAAENKFLNIKMQMLEAGGPK